MKFVWKEFAAFVEKDGHVVEAVERDNALLNVKNLELFIDVSICERT